MGWGEIRVRVKLELGFNLGYGEIRVRLLLGLRFHIGHQHHILASNYVGDQHYLVTNITVTNYGYGSSAFISSNVSA